MEIGKKIKRIRTSKNMTQAELAGDKITRNMLSQIENGSAVPSVGTMIYIAEKLEMPVGYFLSEPENDFVYQKMMSIDAIKKAYRSGDFKKCIDICGDRLPETDDELDLILCECHFKAGKEHFEKGRLNSAHRSFNISLGYAEKTVYNVSWIRISSYAYLELIGTLTPSLRFETKYEYGENDTVSALSDICSYIRAKNLIEEGKEEEAKKLVSLAPFSESPFAEHVKAKLEMRNKNYKAAYNILADVLKNEDTQKLGNAVLYIIYFDLEICCRELKDFENAYAYATKKAKILPEAGI